jgi:acyl-CoA thioester hydrolase
VYTNRSLNIKSLKTKSILLLMKQGSIMQEKKLIHEIKIPVRWGDMDSFGHVNNIIYFLYAQEARFALMRDNNLTIDTHKIAPILAATSCKFIRPIVYPETVMVETWFSHIEGKKLFFDHIIKSVTKPDVVYAILEATTMWFDFRANQSISIPDNIITVFGIEV